VTPQPSIPEIDQGKAKTIEGVVAYVKEQWNREVNEKTIRNWFKPNGTVRNYRQGRLYVFSISDLDAATKG
jgi:hypothetical protein